eukprot:TRINITY_DN1851_c0_g1_i1.p1 TRINITY_DN1851_c0_g1~~TRINITY_DN1851_c0_g1_i1.p1  ORF type:complete len:336 (-),score=74.32 TRINITY_DN1851_c0_g1_i1:168-1142(-)
MATNNVDGTPKKRETVVPILSAKDFGLLGIKNLLMGGIAGMFAASIVYPMDMVKTRLQFQKSTGTPLYTGTLDCFRKILASEGILGFYRGLPAQLVGVAPEKAIKLTVNDMLRYTFTDKETGHLPVHYEILAGAGAGFTQVVATTPYELVKVRLQTDKGHGGKGIFDIVKELGFRKMFTGYGATLLRDVPFSAAYFASYSHLKKVFADENGKNSVPSLFIAGTSAGVICAGGVTPADVIKTRLQAQANRTPEPGVVFYKGIRDCFVRTLREEGPKALFKGVTPRVLIVAPLFGIALMVYEVLQKYFLPPSLTQVGVQPKKVDSK